MKFLVSALSVVAIVVSLFPTPGSAATDPDKFVRTANYFLMSGTVLGNPETLATLSEFDLIVIPSEAQAYNQDFFPAIRAKNPDIVILAYVPTVSWNHVYWTDPLHEQQFRSIQESWWLTDAAGNKKSVWHGTTALNLNSGWNEELSSFVQTDIMSTGYWDGVFYDEVQDSIDWIGPIDTDNDGQNDIGSAANTRWANAYVKLFSDTRTKLGPGAIIITNGSSNRAFAPFVNGRMFETFPSSTDSLNQWSQGVNDYLALEDDLGYPAVNVLNVNTQNTGARADYQKVRFGITSTLLGDGYFAFDFGTQNHAQLWTYDEYDAFLGGPKDHPENLLNPGQTTIGQGVWQRDFENGKVVVNATPDTQTISLGGEFERLHGSQDPAFNDGSITSRITLQSRDGVVLLRPVEEINDATFLNGAFARVFSGKGVVERTGFFAYDSAHRGGTRVIHFDIDLDGKRETVVANDTWVYIYDDDGSLHAQFAPYTETYRLGINIAIGDIESDGSVEIVTGTENGGGPQIRIFNKDGNLIHPGFFAYDTGFRGGVNVAIGDLNGDNIKEIIAGAGVGGGPHVRVFNKDGRVINPGFFAYDPAFRGGVNVAVGDVNGDGVDDIVTGPGAPGGPHVRVFDKDGKMSVQFYAFEEADNRGIDVVATDLDGDQVAEIVGLSTDVFTISLF